MFDNWPISFEDIWKDPQYSIDYIAILLITTTCKNCKTSQPIKRNNQKISQIEHIWSKGVLNDTLPERRLFFPTWIFEKFPTLVIQTEGTENQFWNKLKIVSYEEVHSPSLIIKMKYLLWSVAESLCECEYSGFIYCPESAFWQLCKLVSGLRGYATTGCWPGETCDLAPVFFVWLASSFFRLVAARGWVRGEAGTMTQGGWGGGGGGWRDSFTLASSSFRERAFPTVFVSSRAA